MVDKILAYLESVNGEPLPTTGFLAGQAVAEAYFIVNDLDIKTRIKDLDIFYQTKDSFKLNSDTENKMNINMKINKVALEYSSKSYTKNVLVGSFKYEKIDILRNNKLRFNIVNTYNKGLINYVEMDEISFSKKRYSDIRFGKAILNIFDLNSVQIGISLKSKKLIIHDNFLLFLKTRQVNIVSYVRPIRTFFRFIEKSTYYQNVYFNIDYEINLLLPCFYEVLFKLQKNISGDSMISDIYEASSLNVKTIIKKYFTIKKYSFFNTDLININNYRLNEFNAINLNKEQDNVYLSLINIDNKNIDDILNNNLIIQNSKLDNIALKRRIIKLSRLKRIDLHKKTIKTIKNNMKLNNEKGRYIIISNEINCIRVKPIKARFNKNVFNSIMLIHKNKYNKRYLNKNFKLIKDLLTNINFNQLLYNEKIIEKFLYYYEKIGIGFVQLIKILINHYSLKEILEIRINDLRLIVRHEYLIYIWNNHVLKSESNKKNMSFFVLLDFVKIVSKNHNFIIGRIESNSLSINCIKYNGDKLDLFLENTLKMLSIDCLNINSFLPKIENFKIRQVYNTLDLMNIGDRMKHCVGGYTKQLISMRSLIFDIYDSKNKRITLEVGCNYSNNVNKLIYIQAKYHLNILPDKKTVLILKKFILNLENELFNIKQNFELFKNYIDSKKKIKE